MSKNASVSYIIDTDDWFWRLCHSDPSNLYKFIIESGFMPEEHQEQDSDNLEYEPRLDELMSLSEAAKQTEISASHLRLLVRNGDVWGRKMGRNWVTTKAAVEQYLAQEHKTGPKPKKGPID